MSLKRIPTCQTSSGSTLTTAAKWMCTHHSAGGRGKRKKPAWILIPVLVTPNLYSLPQPWLLDLQVEVVLLCESTSRQAASPWRISLPLPPSLSLHSPPQAVFTDTEGLKWLSDFYCCCCCSAALVRHTTG